MALHSRTDILYKILCTHTQVKILIVYQFFVMYVCVDRNGGKMEHKMYGEIRVAQYTKQGELIKIWDSQMEASEVTGISQSSISQCCNSKTKTAGGFRWSFI